MAAKKLRFTRQTNMFGTTIMLSSKDGTYNETLTEGFGPQDPLRNFDPEVKTGYLFRSPNVSQDNWSSTFNGLHNSDGKFNIVAELEEKNGDNIVTAWVRFAEKEDAAMFAWSQVDHWQKWSDDLEKEEKVAKNKKPTLNVDKDGKITVTVTATTLDR